MQTIAEALEIQLQKDLAQSSARQAKAAQIMRLMVLVWAGYKFTA
jgi:hypothetical protein